MRESLAHELEQVKDINKTLNSFKADGSNSQYNANPPYRDYSAPMRRHEEPTRDPDVWPPPTPVEHKYVFIS